MPTVGVSEYDHDWLVRMVKAGIRPSKMRIVSEALAQTRRRFEREAEEELQVRAEIKERKEETKGWPKP